MTMGTKYALCFGLIAAIQAVNATVYHDGTERMILLGLTSILFLLVLMFYTRDSD